MIRPEPRVIKGLAAAIRQHPEVLLWLKDIRDQELKRLPWAVENSAVFQGRCQMMHELVEFVEQTPAMAAKY